MGKRVVITGATSGIGRALTDELIAQHDCDIVAIGRNTEVLASLARQYQTKIETIVCDFSDIDNCHQAFAAISGKIDIVVNNAMTLNPLGDLKSIKTNEFQQAFNINVIAALVLIQHCLPLLSKHARLLNIGTRLADNPLPGLGAHCVTKAALHMLTKALQQELSASGILVAELKPGVVSTENNQRIRSLPKDKFPIVKKFNEYKEQGIVLTPQACAARIAEVLLTSSAQAFVETDWNFYQGTQESDWHNFSK